MGIQTKTNRALAARVFPHLALVTYIFFEFWFSYCYYYSYYSLTSVALGQRITLILVLWHSIGKRSNRLCNSCCLKCLKCCIFDYIQQSLRRLDVQPESCLYRIAVASYHWALGFFYVLLHAVVVERVYCYFLTL